jgi:hypothetical protein
MNRARAFSLSSMAGLDPAIQLETRADGWPARGPAMTEFLSKPFAKVLL